MNKENKRPQFMIGVLTRAIADADGIPLKESVESFAAKVSSELFGEPVKTYRDFKTFVMTLDENQLDQPMTILREDNMEYIAGFWELEEDHVSPNGDGLEPISAYSKENDPEYDEDEGLPDVVCEKGTVFILSHF